MYDLRPYQSESLEAVLRELAVIKSTLVVMATGLGKTILFSCLAQRWKIGRVLVVAHRKELIHQAAGKLESVLGESVGVEMGKHRAAGGLVPPRVVVGSIQTLARLTRLARFKPAEFSLIVIDEAHHAAAKGYRQVLKHFRDGNPEVRVCGVTATPKRHDKLAMKSVFDTMAYNFGMRDGIDAGWLVSVRQMVARVEGLDFSNVKTAKGDFSEAELAEILSQEGPLHETAVAIHQHAGNRPGIVFCAGVKHAHLLAAVLTRYGRTAVALDGETDDQERDARVIDYKEGRIQFLINCGLFLEGFDAPATAFIGMARPTLSLALYEQMIGRGTRTLTNVIEGYDAAGNLTWRHDTPARRRQSIAGSTKPDVLVLDFAGNAGRHRIVTALDILGGKFAAEVIDYAKKCMEEGEYDAASVDAALERAKLEMAVELEEMDRRKHIRAKSGLVRLEDVNPFGGSAAAPTVAAKPKKNTDPATPKQIRLLCLLGVPEQAARKYHKRQAGKIIDDLKKKRGWS